MTGERECTLCDGQGYTVHSPTAMPIHCADPWVEVECTGCNGRGVW